MVGFRVPPPAETVGNKREASTESSFWTVSCGFGPSLMNFSALSPIDRMDPATEEVDFVGCRPSLGESKFESPVLAPELFLKGFSLDRPILMRQFRDLWFICTI